MTTPDIIIDTHEADLAPVFVTVKDVQSRLHAATAEGLGRTPPDAIVMRRVQTEVAKMLCHWLHVPETATFEVDVRRREFNGGFNLVVTCSSDSNVVDAQLFAIGMLQQGDHPISVGLS